MTYLTTTEVAAKLRIDPSSVRRLIESGKLPALAVNVGKRKHWRIPEDALAKLQYKPEEEKRTKESEPDLVLDPFPLLKRFAKSVR